VTAAGSTTALPSDLNPKLEDAEDDQERLPQDHCAGDKIDADTQFGECVYGDTSAPKTLILLGDSHAGMWSTSLDLAGRRAGWQLLMYAQSGCPAPRITFFKNDAPNTGCDDFREKAIQAIVVAKPDAVLVTSATFLQRTGGGSDDYASAEEWQAGLTGVLTDLKASGARLIVLGDMPVLEQPAAECLAAHQQDVQGCGTPRDVALADVYHAAEKAAANATGATYIDPTDWFCAETCPPIVGSMLVYRNRFHVTATYATFLAGAVRMAIGPL
jgi:hypothetical protein